jgi:hypothetical protein
LMVDGWWFLKITVIPAFARMTTSIVVLAL